MPRLAVDRRWDRLGPLMGRAIAVAGTLMAGCTFGRGPEPVRDQMLAHFELAAELRQSALMGDLRGVRRAADRLVDLERPPDLAADRGDDVLPLARAARDAGRARTADEAARATARVARACADCHLASRVGLGNRLGVPYTEGAAARRHTPALAR
ncbi:MAG TPA: hypothetical protein VLA09_09305, partial [Longimicrobiales bacterium]|nr:hypothetical protein [Longimicrobiales bacterium]